MRPRLTDVVRGFPRPEPGTPGDPGLFGPGSMVWRVNGELATILGGGRALLMQLADPMVAAGVADHSDFERNAFARLWRTLDAVLTVAFGDRGQAEAAAERVNRVHERVVGDRGGTPYRALDPELLLWVHATLVDTGLLVYETFLRPLAPPARERYYAEMTRFASAFRVPAGLAPPDLDAFERYVQGRVATLEVSTEARRLAHDVLGPPAPVALAPARALLREVTIGLLPPRLRAGFGLAWSPGRERAHLLGSAAIRRTLPLLPSNIRRWPHARAAEGRSEAK